MFSKTGRCVSRTQFSLSHHSSRKLLHHVYPLIHELIDHFCLYFLQITAELL